MANTEKLEQLVDIRKVKIDMSLSKEERIKEFIKKVGDPYCFKVGNVIVRSSFKANEGTLQEKMECYLETSVI